MFRCLSEALLSELSCSISTRTGLSFPKERWTDLERGLKSAAEELGFKHVEAYAEWLLSSHWKDDQVQILATHLTVGETYFFRDQNTFKILEEEILPGLISARRQGLQLLRIWSAGCCTGEEAYSIAILLKRLILDLDAWNITVLATDINRGFLRKAAEGVYSEWSFRDVPAWVKQRYFKKKKEGQFRIDPDLKKLVTFSYLNLAEDSYPSLLSNTNAMDIIFCRNVLMYFAPAQIKTAIGNLHRSLVEGGWLIVSPAEASHELFSQFKTVSFPGAILYRKGLVQQEAGTGPRPLATGWPPNADLRPLSSDPERPIIETLIEEKKEPQIEETQHDPYAEALALYEQGRYDQAREKMQTILSGNAADSKGRTLLARIYANQGRLAEAQAWCEKAIAADRLEATNHYLLATILQEGGKAKQAIGSLQRALYLNQDFVVAHFALGNLMERQRKKKESIKHFSYALALLQKYQANEILPESDGMTAGRLMQIISITMGEKPALKEKTP